MMKSFALLTAMALLPLISINAAPTANGDTVKVIKNAHQVIITEDSTGMKVNIDGAGTNNDYHYVYKNEHKADDKITTAQDEGDWNIKLPFSKTDTTMHHWSAVMNGITIGWGNISSDSKFPEFDNQLSHVFEFGITNFVALQYSSGHGQNVSFGFGANIKSYRLKDKYRFNRTSNGFTVNTYPDSINGKSSNFELFSLQFPLLFNQRLCKHLHLTVGPILNVNVASSFNTHYKIGYTDFNESTTHTHQRIVTWDLMGALTYHGVGIYFRYTPSKVFKSGYGPQFNTWTAGLAIGF
jgi:hypothetical protein